MCSKNRAHHESLEPFGDFDNWNYIIRGFKKGI